MNESIPVGPRSPVPPASLDLARRVLAGRHVRLEPYAEGLREDVRAALDCDPDAWRLFAVNGQGQDFDTWWRTVNALVAQDEWVAYAVRSRATDTIVGTTSFLSLKRTRQCVEIGGTFLHPDVRGTLANAEAKYLMLAHAFACGARRVELLTDSRNVRSQAAIAKLGAVREGVLRRERVTWTGHVRDSVLFAVTDLDWPDVRARLERRLGIHPAEDAGHAP
ncbi:GNAT family N-acetyltransferase [Massilia sp. TW-1]|uniref:GNAT family N-acetyltransferase n=1 Tax=Telluria antibiotica TaxID=2717319 RepID=A0ABX0P8D7_9BURK|nr:GNAT family protein [Telluria antibiotica]NIA52828.1 GNAT family N-acetyltransferase [Telluria antibiotica]